MRRTRSTKLALLATAAMFIAPAAFAQTAATPAPPAQPAAAPAQPQTIAYWMNNAKSPDERARLALAAMSLDEKLALVTGFADGGGLDKVPDDVVSPAVKADVAAHAIKGAAGYVPAIDRLHIPAQYQTDASIGVRVEGLPRTALPSSLATAASFDPNTSEAGGKMIGWEARNSGFNMMLAGGANLAREPRNGRNFEYVGEDPFLAGQMAGALIRGIESNHIASTMKHFAVNDQESLRTTVDSQISEKAMRQSDLLAFEIAMEQGNPQSVMCSYNLVNGAWACENDYLLANTLKQQWAFKGFVMSDWGAVHSTAKAANAGLDQLTGYPCCGDHVSYFGPALKEAVASGAVSQARLDDMVTRILYAMFASGSYDEPVKADDSKIDYAVDGDIAQTAAENSLVLLKNTGNLLPLRGVKSVAVIGSHADKGVLSGGGSSSVTPVGGNPVPDGQPTTWPGPVRYLPSSPVDALKAELPDAKIDYNSGDDVAAAVAAAKASDVAVVFVNKWNGEGFDSRLELDGNQDALVQAVVAANPKTVVVVESGGAVLMPWADRTPAILEAFYPGARGGPAIARILTGKVNPSGHLPITFPASNAQLARADVPGFGAKDGSAMVKVDYNVDGAAIGYKWYDLKNYKPLFAFGHGLSYTTFQVSKLQAKMEGADLVVSGVITNTGQMQGKGVAQIYLAPQDWKAAGWEAPKRLIAFQKVDLAPGASAPFTQHVDSRLMATFNPGTNSWVVFDGQYKVMLGQAADDLPQKTSLTLHGTTWGAAKQ